MDPQPASPAAIPTSPSQASQSSAAPQVTQPLPSPPPAGATIRALGANPLPPSQGPSFSGGSLAAGLLLAGLTVAALLLARRKRRSSRRLVEVLESASLGPKRSLVVARMGDELLLLGSSEGGIALLATQPAPQGLETAPLADSAAPSEDAGTGIAEAALGVIARLMGRLPAQAARPAAAASPVSPFDGLLTESLEDVELRQKLSAGQAGMVR